MSTPVTPGKKAIARHAAAAFGGRPQVQAYYNDDKTRSVDILWCDDRPVEGVTAFSTVGLSDTPMIQGRNVFPTRLEVCAAAATSADAAMAHVLATFAFILQRTQYLFAPGTVARDVVAEYVPDSPLRHLYLTAPFLWEDSLKAIAVDGRQTAWLLGVPISESERTHLEQNGDDALERLFEESQIDIYDLRRPPVV